MATRVGIELSPSVCRVIELDADGRWSERGVAAYSVAPRVSSETLSRLASLRGRRAAVVLWGSTNDHRQVAVARGSYERMLAEARAAVRMAGVQKWRTLTDIAPVSEPEDDRDSRTVVLVSAAVEEVATALRPLLHAGIRVDRVVTPAAALLSLARTYRTPNPGFSSLEAYVALEETVTCIALVRDLRLVAARDFAWGYLDDPERRATLRSREDLVRRLSADFSAMMGECRLKPESLRHVCLCGPLPELRSAAMAFTEQLDAEVEPLDAPLGIDAHRLPQSSNDFRERAAELRLAWAAASDDDPPIDLFRAGRRRARTANWSRAAVAAGVATGLLVGSQVAPSIAAAIPSGERVKISSRAPLAVPVVDRDPIDAPRPASPVRPPAVSPAAGPAVADVAPDAGSHAATITQTLPTARKADTGRRGLPPPAIAQPSEDLPPEASDATLDGILLGPDRKLAIIDGRIVQPGDEVRGAVVVDITPAAVVLRDRSGRLRHVTSGRPAR